MKNIPRQSNLVSRRPEVGQGWEGSGNDTSGVRAELDACKGELRKIPWKTRVGVLSVVSEVYV